MANKSLVPKSLIDLGIRFLVNRLLCHIAFWVVVTATTYISQFLGTTDSAGLASPLADIAIMVALTYTLVFLVIPHVLYKSKIALFVITCLISILFFSYINFEWYKIIYGAKNMGESNFLMCSALVILFIVMVSALKIMRDLALEVHAYGITQEQHMQQELNFLRNQLSPHFLLNTMNNLYGLSVQKNDQLPSLILRLSDLLRYSIYDGINNMVSLKEELAYLKDYIELQRIRLNDDVQLHVNLPNVISEHYKIAPMILVVFIENAFKHGATANAGQKKFINLDISIEHDNLIMILGNSIKIKSQAPPALSVPRANLRSDGIGLANTLRRIELLYGKEALPKIKTCENTYNTELKLKLHYA